MFKRNLWKIVLSLAIAGWAASELIPIADVPFPTYVREHATAKTDEFNTLLNKAADMKKSGAAPSEFVALKEIGRDQRIDLSQFFPGIRLEDTLRNVEKRNNILLNELLRRSRRKLQLGLDLQGGVGFTLEAELGDKTAGLDSGGRAPAEAHEGDRHHQRAHQFVRRRRAAHKGRRRRTGSRSSFPTSTPRTTPRSSRTSRSRRGSTSAWSMPARPRRPLRRGTYRRATR